MDSPLQHEMVFTGGILRYEDGCHPKRVVQVHDAPGALVNASVPIVTLVRHRAVESLDVDLVADAWRRRPLRPRGDDDLLSWMITVEEHRRERLPPWIFEALGGFLRDGAALHFSIDCHLREEDRDEIDRVVRDMIGSAVLHGQDVDFDAAEKLYRGQRVDGIAQAVDIWNRQHGPACMDGAAQPGYSGIR